MFYRLVDPQRAVLPAADSGLEVQWWGTQRGVGLGPIGEFALLPEAADSTLLIPGELVHLTTAVLPGRRLRLWRQALPYALEDSLADNVDSLHFIVGPTLPNGAIAAAAVRKDLLHGWRELTTQFTPRRIIPDVLCVPYPDDGWSLVRDGQRCLVRCGPYSGFCCSLETLPTLLDLALEQIPSRPERIWCWGDLSLGGNPLGGNPLGGNPLGGAVTERLEMQPRAEVTELFERGEQQGPVLNLIEANQNPRKSGAARWRPWRFAAVLAGLLVLAQGARQGLEYVQLRQQQTTLKNEISALFQQALPDARRMVDARVQIENLLRDLQHNETTDNTFFELLAAGGRGLTHHSAIELRGLRYSAGALNFLLEGENLEDFDALNRMLSADEQRIAVEMRTSKRERTVESRLALRKL